MGEGGGPPTDTTWGFGITTLSVLPDFLERGRSNTLMASWEFERGLHPTIDHGTCTVYDGSGNVVSTGPVTPSSDFISYTFTPSASLPYGEGWRSEWAVVEIQDGVPRTFTLEREAMLCRRRLLCPVIVDLLWLHAPALNPEGAEPITALTKDDQSTMLFLSWLRVQGRLLELGKRPFLVIGSSALAEVTTNTALAMIFGALAHRLNENYQAVADQYEAKAEECWKRLRLDYDETQDGVVDGRRAAKPAAVWIGRGR